MYEQLSSGGRLDNYIDESPLEDADKAVAQVWQYLEEALPEVAADAPINRFMTDGLSAGIEREKLIVNIGAFLLISLSNTAGVSSAYLLRNLIQRPLEIDVTREFTGENNIIFGGSMYMCIGKQLGLALLKDLARGFVQHLPDTAQVEDSEIVVDGDWVTERAITRMPIDLG